MVEQIIKTAIGIVVSSVAGFLVATLKNYKKKNDGLKTAMMTMLQSNISNTYFLYEPANAIPDYLYRNILNEFRAYKQLGGNDYIEHIMNKMEDWEITRTDILK